MKRIRYFDLLRCISFCFIIFYHMISQLYFSGLFTLDKVLPFYENDNMNIAMLGVAVFLSYPVPDSHIPQGRILTFDASTKKDL